jgi:hypothetical protein
LAASAITIIRSLAVATIFSCKSAAPPPLIRFRFASNSSAPSMVRSSHFVSSSETTVSPRLRARSAVREEVATHVTDNPLSRTRSARQRTIQAAVDPVPSPSFMPFSTKSTDRRAATNLAWSIGESSAAMDFPRVS